MIYMVDHVYADPATEAEWHAWYRGYLSKLVAVPGIHSAQRFKALACAPSRFLAIYSVDSADVFTSEPYKAIGGGGSQSARFHPAYRLWTRNLFVGADVDGRHDANVRAPVVKESERVLVFDRDQPPPRRLAPPLLDEEGNVPRRIAPPLVDDEGSSPRRIASPLLGGGEEFAAGAYPPVKESRERSQGDCVRGGPNDIDRLAAQATWLQSVGLHMTTKYRGYLVLDAQAAEAASIAGSFLYEPFTSVIS